MNNLPKPQVSIVIVTWNAQQLVPYVFQSIFEQSFTDFEVLVIDNGSVDATVSVLREQFPKVKISPQKTNLGFSRGYNLGIHWTTGEYVVVMNQDVILDPEYIAQAVAFLQNESTVAAVQGKILRWHIPSNQRRDIVDTLGIDILPSHQCINRAEGQVSPKKEQSAAPVFAFSGSLVTLRRQALQDVQFEQEFFDEDFFSYKEDIDLSWRLRHRNWDIVYVPTAIAYHGRSVKKHDQTGWKSIMAHRKKKQAFLNYISYRNHWFLLYKNQYVAIAAKYGGYLGWYEFKKFVYLLFFEQYTLKAFFDMVRIYPRMRKKRIAIFSRAKSTPQSMCAWISK